MKMFAKAIHWYAACGAIPTKKFIPYLKPFDVQKPKNPKMITVGTSLTICDTYIHITFAAQKLIRFHYLCSPFGC